MAKKSVYRLFIPKDTNPDNSKKEQYKIFQLNGVTIEVPIGKFVEVPEWVAVRAKEINPDCEYTVD